MIKPNQTDIGRRVKVRSAHPHPTAAQVAERLERAERNERTERPERSERTERTERAERPAATPAAPRPHPPPAHLPPQPQPQLNPNQAQRPPPNPDLTRRSLKWVQLAIPFNVTKYLTGTRTLCLSEWMGVFKTIVNLSSRLACSI